MSRLTVSSSPHIRHPDTVPRIMWSVSAALLPALVASGYFFGWRAYFVTALSIATAVACEAGAQWLRRRPVTVSDGSAVVTGILVAFCMPATVRWFVPVVGSAAAILIAKHCFGGLGNNIWNPALVGRALVHNSFPADMNPSSYPVVRTAHTGEGLGAWLRDVLHHLQVNVGTTVGGDGAPDAITGASPLTALKGRLIEQPDAAARALGREFVEAFRNTAPAAAENPGAPEGAVHPVGLLDAFLGNIGGNIGEVCALLLLAGAVFLVLRGAIRWYVPVLYVGTVAVLVAVLPLPLGGEESKWVWAAALRAGEPGGRYVGYHVLCGGLMLGALYMATDMVTTPLARKGLVVFAVGCGVLTALIRLYGGYPEGVCYSILLMNTAVPLIDRWTRPRVFGVAGPAKAGG